MYIVDSKNIFSLFLGIEQVGRVELSQIERTLYRRTVIVTCFKRDIDDEINQPWHRIFFEASQTLVY